MSAPPKVLVTGAAGFIGSHVATALETRGADVATLVRPVDYHDAKAVESLLEEVRPSVLVHSAWRLAQQRAHFEDPANTEEIGASLQLFKLARAAGCRRVVGIGTCAEYEQSVGPVAEDAPLRPQTLYGASKAALFLAAESWARVADVSFSWARIYYAFGPREPANRLIPTVVNRLLQGERVATTSGEQRRSLLYAADVGDAIAAITLSEISGPVNVGADGVIAMRELVERLGGLLGRPELLDIGALPSRPNDPAVLWPQVDKLSSIVKWRPSRNLEEGLDQTIAWWRARR